MHSDPPADDLEEIDGVDGAAGSDRVGAAEALAVAPGAPIRLARPDRVLVLRLGALGDVVRTLPAVRALREALPGAHLAWLVEERAAGILRARRWLDEVIVLPRARWERQVRAARLPRGAGSWLRGLRKRRFDWALDFHAIAKSALLARLSGAPVRVGYAPPFAGEGAWIVYTHRVRPTPRRQSRYARNAALVRALGLPAAPGSAPLEPAAEALARVEAGGLPAPAPVAMHPGSSSGTPHKRYAPERLGQVARWLLRRHGVSTLVCAGPGQGEAELATAIVAASGGAARHAPATRSPEELAALLSRCALFVGPDSGPLHLAALVGTPVVQILGPTHPVENAPWPGTASRQVRRPLACSPCRRGCAPAHCMTGLPVDAVAAAASALLEGSSRPATGLSLAG